MTAPAVLQTREFDDLRTIIMDEVGICLNASKRTLLEGRLGRRLREHSFTDYREYLELVREDKTELREMINAVTTNKTSFFRESHHFDMLGKVLQTRDSRLAPLHVWSSACSSGEEPYSIAITARQAMRAIRIVASDVDTNVLASAAAGVYDDDQREELPAEMLRRHFLRGRGTSEGKMRVHQDLQRMIEFKHINLMAPSWPFTEQLDVIFCRNVIIYFDRPTQDRLFRRYAELLVPGGLLFLGHSESLSWMPDLFEPVGHTVYRYTGKGASGARAPRAPLRVVPRDSSATRVVPRAAQHLVPSPKSSVIVRIDAGELKASRTPTEIRTVLGSCVAACVYDPFANVGGMNHFMLPDGSHDHQPARYGVHAMELLINQIMKLGGERSRLRAKVFGGANVIRMERSGVDVGRDNIEFIRRFLTTEGIPIEGERLGGTQPLEVRMHATTGRVQVRALGTARLPDEIAAERKSVASRLGRSAAAAADTADINDVMF
ncbi:MAG TPA: CheR family methyltransferase [Gemmatimonadaceae bacterium]|jgi:chemotaxis protein methyltransferase CheR